ncbi:MULTISPECIES: phage tail protein [Mammaliicoccus]|uniref:Phage tail protein n=1 Tax=Mammaliicoccus sciuri TaxID=1296 RepID=A0AAW5LSV8_MAMSC|nr:MULTISPECIES: phage tail protein [Mammaliicoccus]MCQ9305008.1 phage tail protein [Mammaliicoccus sciuri]
MASYIAVVEPANNELPDAEGYLVSDLQEGEHNISAELSEKVIAGKTDYEYTSVAEEFTFTTGRIPGDKGQEQFKKAIKARQQVRVWLIEKKKQNGVYPAIFGYAVVEELGNSFDDEEDTIEVTLKVKFNTAEGGFESLPQSWLDPSVAGTTVEYEEPGAYKGSLENREAVSGSGA